MVGYTRVSTDEQASSGLGLKAQRTLSEAECERRDWKLVEVFEDAGTSGKAVSGRPALAKALEAVRGGDASALVVAKLDRLSRSLLDFASIAKERRRGRSLREIAEGLNLEGVSTAHCGSKWHASKVRAVLERTG